MTTGNHVLSALIWCTALVVPIACSDDEADYDAATERRTVEAYEHYLASHPNGMYIEEARAAIGAIEDSLAQIRLRSDLEAYLRELYEHPMTQVLTNALTPGQGRDVAYITLTEGWGFTKRAFSDSGTVIVPVPGDGPLDPSAWPQLLDPWDTPIRLEVRVQNGTKTPTVVSSGPDGQGGTSDDVRYPSAATMSN